MDPLQEKRVGLFLYIYIYVFIKAWFSLQLHRQLHQACKDNDVVKVDAILATGQAKVDYPDEVTKSPIFFKISKKITEFLSRTA